ncbi:MotE family protein [Oceanicella actignis]|uniref:Flagellar motility protein MotE, a chaperone for MotC folding n=1 Tax=Oceanicella actignis TaxID=1189325 RepID=A0A1M7T677_9RHOB|nr:hypothetical protein [Oceanicella actignis]TYO84828.1 hypothetical protein LY05_02801 [Oceanicella actignis]SET44442.1 hypothetical protein SAMN04488119_104233 [Oceanicella actignis]SHN66250.1 hypothetical protein SAMN05216200_104233 [Oceanicella actignis]
MNRPGALTIVGLCFAASAGLRLADPDGAIAKEAAHLASEHGAPQTKAAAEDCPDPGGLLAALRERQAQLDAREGALADREKLLEAARAELDEQLARVKAAEASLAETLALADKAAEKDIARLVSVYEAMKPKNAARVLESMEVTFAAGLVARMNKNAAAAIMAAMSPEKAYAISVIVAGRNANVPTE